MVLQVENLTTQFDTGDGTVTAVDNVSFALPRGTTVGLLGESGCGKTVTCLSIMRLLPKNGRITRGQVFLGSTNLAGIPESEMRRIRGGRISMVLQEPRLSFNPYLRMSRQMVETIRCHSDVSAYDARVRSIDLLREVGIPDSEKRIEYFPHQFSGGMLQRILIALAIGCGAEVLIADEPTSALDVTTQGTILGMMKRMAAKKGLSILFITHDLGVAAEVCDSICVMYAGRLVEAAPASEMYSNPIHPYTKALMNTIPRISSKRDNQFQAIPGHPPVPGSLPAGCAFHPRCAEAVDECRQAVPQMLPVGDNRFAACIRAR